MIGNNSSGFANEHEIVEYINSKRIFSNLNENMQEFMKFIFGSNLDGTDIYASLITGGYKPDISITHKNITKYVSIKKGTGNSVHQESLTLFCEFLKENNVHDDIIESLKRFHYGDNTTDGTGPVRMSSQTWVSKYFDEIHNLNKVLNEKPLRDLIIYRVLFIGNKNNPKKVDAIFHGTLDSAYWASRDEVIRFLQAKKYNNGSVNISTLGYQAWNRNINRNPNTENRRHVMQIKWSSLTNDLATIRRLNGK